jgi:hypothetical protein
MSKYRIVELNNGKFAAQEKGLFSWKFLSTKCLFKYGSSDFGAREFFEVNSVEEARKTIKRFQNNEKPLIARIIEE